MPHRVHVRSTSWRLGAKPRIGVIDFAFADKANDDVASTFKFEFEFEFEFAVELAFDCVFVRLDVPLALALALAAAVVLLVPLLRLEPVTVLALAVAVAGVRLGKRGREEGIARRRELWRWDRSRVERDWVSRCLDWTNIYIDAKVK